MGTQGISLGLCDTVHILECGVTQRVPQHRFGILEWS